MIMPWDNCIGLDVVMTSFFFLTGVLFGISVRYWCSVLFGRKEE